MTTYIIADVAVTDDSWVPDYAAKVHDIAAKTAGAICHARGMLTR